jgi:hypothetical protein
MTGKTFPLTNNKNEIIEEQKRGLIQRGFVDINHLNLLIQKLDLSDPESFYLFERWENCNGTHQELLKLKRLPEHRKNDL